MKSFAAITQESLVWRRRPSNSYSFLLTGLHRQPHKFTATPNTTVRLPK